MKHLFYRRIFGAVCLFAAVSLAQAAEIRLEAKETISVAEMDRGDVLEFKLKNGERRVFELVSTSARVLYSNLKELKKAQAGGGTVYEMSCTLKAEGELVTLRRYVCTQEAFYEPWVINGVRIWFDAVSDIEAFITFKHGPCKPSKQARFALQDATLRICPEEVLPWYDNPARFIDIGITQNGDDCWMGAFSGADAHNGLDINQAAGTLNYAPIDFDEHYLFESLAAGDNNNRWRGVRRWANGDTWMLQTHHLLSLLVPAGTALKAGTAFCSGAGVKYGAHEHSHYMFKVLPAGATEEVLIDPWIVFWQGFEDQRKRLGGLSAEMGVLAPAKVGQAVAFNSQASHPGPRGELRRVVWTFGDGGVSHLANPVYAFARPGVYPVTLTVDDGAHIAATTQHITVRAVSGEEHLAAPALVFDASDEPVFRVRPQDAADVYGIASSFVPCSLRLVSRAENQRPRVREVFLKNIGGGTLSAAKVEVQYLAGGKSDAAAKKWLSVKIVGEGNEQMARVQVNSAGLAPACYLARVEIETPGAVNAHQSFDVELLVPSHPALPPKSQRVQIPREKIVDDSTISEFYATPWFWISQRLAGHPQGNKGGHLMNGKRDADGEFVRFTPDLRKGRYQIRFTKVTPFEPGVRFSVRVRYGSGVAEKTMEPEKSLVIGEYSFEDGTDGYVEIRAEGSVGQVLADALIFKRLD